MVKAEIYLNFNGNTEEAFNFYRSVFGGEFSSIMRYKEMPDTTPVTPVDREKVMHMTLPLGKDMLLMGSDVPEAMAGRLRMGNNFYISIDADTKAEADLLFNKLSSGGAVQMAMADMFWGSYWGSLTDRFGVQWMIGYTKKD